ncbi:MAG: histidine phosphatase family protein [Oscillospiraceae bacterium]|nr:histidine phosphatase family protein [Oscillospiraceae bacterium]
MTIVYFIRHAESDFSVSDDKTRPLTEKGLIDRELVTEYLLDKNIDAVITSPYKRAYDTVSDFAYKNDFKITIVEDFRERKVDSVWIEDFMDFTKKQWTDFSYKHSDGECLAEVQERNVTALNRVLLQHKDKNIVIGTHGTALSTIINYYDKTYNIKDFMAMVNIMPWVVRMDFSDDGCIGMNKVDLFQNNQKPDYNQCRVCVADYGALKAYRFVVIFARYNDKWLYCRCKERDTFETAGGRIEQGESPLDAAKRELYEETGATRFDISPAFDYSVHLPTEYSNGQVFLAQIHALGDIPDFEMAEVKMFDSIPEKMRFPGILPILFKRIRQNGTIRAAGMV